MGVIKEKFGTMKDGKEVYAYTLSNAGGMQVKVINYGANLVSVIVPDRNGNLADVILGYDTLDDYLVNSCFFGAAVGPNANRIAGASFELDGQTYQLDVNDGANNLHSHKDEGYHKRLWDAEEGENSVTFTLEGKDGEMGFPGNKKVSLTYSLSEDNALKLAYHAATDAKTVINMTNHAYFNLAGYDSGTMEEQLLQINASHYTPIVPGAIPTGEIAPVAGTPLDFTKMKPIGQDINADFEQMKMVGGYDHNYVIDGADGTLKEIATVEEPKSGRVMKVFTDLPGVQFYSGNGMTPGTGKGQTPYASRSGFCLETQYYPDNIHQPGFPQAIFGPDKDYNTVTVYQFETK